MELLFAVLLKNRFLNMFDLLSPFRSVSTEPMHQHCIRRKEADAPTVQNTSFDREGMWCPEELGCWVPLSSSASVRHHPAVLDSMQVHMSLRWCMACVGTQTCHAKRFA